VKRALGVVATVLLAATPAAAQSGSTLIFEFAQRRDDDTAYAALSGGTAEVRVRAWDNGNVGLGAFAIRIYYDPTRVSYVGGSARSSCPDSLLHPLSPPVVGANYVELSAGGCTAAGVGTADHDVATVRLRLETGALNGSVLYVDPIAIAQNDGTPRPYDEEAAFSELCRGTTVWGDVNGDVKVGSLDALVALSDAVGLSTTGFNLARADVDDDGRVTSRDALYMLSHAVLLPTPGSRTATAIAEFCAPQTALGGTLFFQTEGPGSATTGEDGLTLRNSNDTASVVLGDSAAPFFSLGSPKWRPRVSPVDGSVLFACYYNSSNTQVCKRRTDGTVTPLAFAPFTQNESPDWSPAGDSIVFIRNGSLNVMDSAGAGARLVPTAGGSFKSVAWNPQAGSRVIAFTQQGCSGAVRTLNVDTGAGAIVAQGDCASAARGQPDLVDWSPAGDSLVFDMYINNRKAVIVAAATQNAPLTKRVSASYHVWEAFWRPEGILFQLQGTLYGQIYLRRNDGTVLRVVRAAKDLHFPGMSKQ
jgi:hypothetical protein